MRIIRKSVAFVLAFSILSMTLGNTFVWGEFYEPDYECCCSDYDESVYLDYCPFPFEGDFTIAFDNFRSLPEGSYEGNTGAFASLNLATAVPFFSCHGFGVQLGSSYGVYDWSGRTSQIIGNNKEVQQQTFLTTGLFRRTPFCSGINFGLVYDWMFNDNFGEFALSPTLAQFRFSGSYLFCCNNEFGLWGTVDTETAHKSTEGIPVSFRAISQINLFWQHYFANCANTVVWVGLPYKRSLMFSSGLAGRFILGASFRVPLTECLSIDGHASYMRPKSIHGPTEANDYASNICFGLTYSFGCSSKCIDKGFRPMMPVANNSNFISDTNINY